MVTKSSSVIPGQAGPRQSGAGVSEGSVSPKGGTSGFFMFGSSARRSLTQVPPSSTFQNPMQCNLLKAIFSRLWKLQSRADGLIERATLDELIQLKQILSPYENQLLEWIQRVDIGEEALGRTGSATRHTLMEVPSTGNTLMMGNAPSTSNTVMMSNAPVTSNTLVPNNASGAGGSNTVVLQTSNQKDSNIVTIKTGLERADSGPVAERSPSKQLEATIPDGVETDRAMNSAPGTHGSVCPRAPPNPSTGRSAGTTGRTGGFAGGTGGSNGRTGASKSYFANQVGIVRDVEAAFIDRFDLVLVAFEPQKILSPRSVLATDYGVWRSRKWHETGLLIAISLIMLSLAASSFGEYYTEVMGFSYLTQDHIELLRFKVAHNEIPYDRNTGLITVVGKDGRLPTAFQDARLPSDFATRVATSDFPDRDFNMSHFLALRPECDDVLFPNWKVQFVSCAIIIYSAYIVFHRVVLALLWKCLISFDAFLLVQAGARVTMAVLFNYHACYTDDAASKVAVQIPQKYRDYASSAMLPFSIFFAITCTLAVLCTILLDAFRSERNAKLYICCICLMYVTYQCIILRVNPSGWTDHHEMDFLIMSAKPSQQFAMGYWTFFVVLIKQTASILGGRNLATVRQQCDLLWVNTETGEALTDMAKQQKERQLVEEITQRHKGTLNAGKSPKNSAEKNESSEQGGLSGRRGYAGQGGSVRSDSLDQTIAFGVMQSSKADGNPMDSPDILGKSLPKSLNLVGLKAGYQSGTVLPHMPRPHPPGVRRAVGAPTHGIEVTPSGENALGKHMEASATREEEF